VRVQRQQFDERQAEERQQEQEHEEGQEVAIDGQRLADHRPPRHGSAQHEVDARVVLDHDRFEVHHVVVARQLSRGPSAHRGEMLPTAGLRPAEHVFRLAEMRMSFVQRRIPELLFAPSQLAKPHALRWSVLI
jgi:hypothetical protein